MKKIYEFLIWNNCNNNCTFCHQRKHERKVADKILSNQERISSLSLCKDFLKNDFEKGNHILLCGGEVFDVTDPAVKQELVSLLDLVLVMMEFDEIELLYLNTNLLYEDMELLIGFLDKVDSKQLFDRLKFTTSYDIEGRFANFKSESLFYKNLKYITNTFPKIKVVVNTVLTKEACKRIKEDRFGADYMLEYLAEQGKSVNTIKDWIDYFRVDINTIPYIKLNYESAPNAPTKEDVFSTLVHINQVIPGYLRRYSDNIGLKQEKLLFEYNKVDNAYIFCSSKMSEDCGHSVNFKQSFADSDDCFPCQMEKLAKHVD